MAKPVKKVIKLATKSAAKPAVKPATKSANKPTPTTESTSQKAKPLTPSQQKKAEALKAQDVGYQQARENAVKYLHGRRQATFSIARHYHLDADDLHQEAYEILLTCLRDFNPLFTKSDGQVVTVQFNTFFGNRLEGKALEMRNRDPEYQARQAHMNDMSEDEKAEFRKAPPLLVQHLDQETAAQEHLRAEASNSQRGRQTNLLMKIAQDSFIEKKLNDLIAAERDDKRRAALMHVKVGGVASFEEIAYHFGVTDSRASQILNELMDAFYVQRLLDGDIKSVAYDFRKTGLNEKRAHRLLEQAVQAAPGHRAQAIVQEFGADYPQLQQALTHTPAPSHKGEERPESGNTPALPAQLTESEEQQFPLTAIEWRPLSTLSSLGLPFRQPSPQAPEDMLHIKKISAEAVEKWPPLIITPEGGVIDGERRIAAASAKGIDRLLCQVRQAPDAKAAQILRVTLNSRTRPLDKIELYFAIAALLTLGLPQGKIAEHLGTSRPNVIVYAKVREKASPALRLLFEDGLIQITNASTAVDLPEKAQNEIADFIRQHGATWGRGPQFTELYEAAAAGQVAHLAPPPTTLGGTSQQSSYQSVAQTYPNPHPHHASGASQTTPNLSQPHPNLAQNNTLLSQTHPTFSATSAGSGGAGQGGGQALVPSVANALKKRQEALETALRDAEIWAKQREATIASQSAQIHELKQSVESMKREIESTSLLAQADEATIANYIKEVKNFYAVEERLSIAQTHLEKATSQLRSLHLSHRQTIELDSILEKIATTHNALRVTLLKRPTTTKS